MFSLKAPWCELRKTIGFLEFSLRAPWGGLGKTVGFLQVFAECALGGQQENHMISSCVG